MTYNRFWDAHMIQQGACNPSGIARALVKACDDARQDGVQAATDEAVRMIVHQLAYLTNNHQIENDMGEYSRLSDACERKSGHPICAHCGGDIAGGYYKETDEGSRVICGPCRDDSCLPDDAWEFIKA